MQYKPRIRYREGRVYVETSYDKDWVNDIKIAVPQHKRWWEPQVGIWAFDASFYQCVLHITQLHFGGDIVDATGGVGEPQDMQWKARLEGRAPAAPKPLRNETPRSILFVTDDAPDYVITAAYRALAARMHPDKGGTDADMQKLNAAYSILTKNRKSHGEARG